MVEIICTLILISGSIGVLSSRLTPPMIRDNGNQSKETSHYDQYGGFEGMRQKAWTLSTIMIIKLALDQCFLKGETMGQENNQVY